MQKHACESWIAIINKFSDAIKFSTGPLVNNMPVELREEIWVQFTDTQADSKSKAF